MMTQKELDAERVIALIDEFKGNLSAVARSLGCARGTLYAYIKGKPTCQKALDNSRETMLDNVESVLYSKALAGEAWAVCFFLKTQGKSRGYVERQEVTGADGGPVIVVNWDDAEDSD